MTTCVHGSQVGVITTTKNRADFIERLLQYLSAINFRGSFHLGDASDDSERGRIFRALELNGKDYEVHVVDCRGMSIGASIHEASKTCSRRYATFIGDDDFFLLPGLDHSVEFLETHSDYAAAHGTGFAFTLDREGPFGVPIQFCSYPMPILEQGTPLERLTFLLTHYGVTLFSVMRTPLFQHIFSDLNRVEDSTFRDELIPCSLVAVTGKVAELPLPHVIRQSHPRRHQLPPIDEWIRSDAFSRSARDYNDRINTEIASIQRQESKEVPELSWGALRIYIARQMAKDVLNIPLSHPNDPRGVEFDPSEVIRIASEPTSPFYEFIRALSKSSMNRLSFR